MMNDKKLALLIDAYRHSLVREMEFLRDGLPEELKVKDKNILGQPIEYYPLLFGLEEVIENMGGGVRRLIGEEPDV